MEPSISTVAWSKNSSGYRCHTFFRASAIAACRASICWRVSK